MQEQKKEKLLRAVRNFLRFIPYYNEYENELLSEDFRQSVQEIKERNSKIVFDAYYLPKAITAILKEDGYLITPQGATFRATAMMLSDLAKGKLNEFYRFKA